MNGSRFILTALILLIAPLSARAGITLPGLEAPVEVIRDANGIPHIYASNEHDLYFMQGRIHARDRLFQMDILRRSAAGTLAELLGQPALPTDVETRTIGLGRAAERSLAEHSAHMLAVLEAYSEGVNSFIDEAEQDPLNRLPPEYLGLSLVTVERWQPLDSVLVGKALAAATSLIVPDDINLTIALGTYEAIGDGSGLFDGAALFFDDLFRSAPFDPASTVPDAQIGFSKAAGDSRLDRKVSRFKSIARKKALEQARDYMKRIEDLPDIPGALPLKGGNMGGSNSWVVGGQHTASGSPLLANDIHLALESPTIFHEMHLVAPGIGVTGSSLPGTPCIVRGHNRSIAWGITNSRLDITDIFAEVIVPAAGPVGLGTLHGGVVEPIIPVAETFSANIGGQVVPIDAASTTVFTVPRRSNGPLITAPETDPDTGITTALSVQSVGFGPTRDLEGFCAVNRAQNLDEFKAALQLIDFASQNLTYADGQGNIGYFVTGEVPLREDLQNDPEGVNTPPFLIRNGFGGNDWIALAGPRPANQATPFEILPFGEMPQVVNPRSGVIVNANNDQAGNTLDNDPLNDYRESGDGLRYLNWGGRNFSIRAGRETEMINEMLDRGSERGGWHSKISFGHMKAIQADTVMNDAKALTPFIVDAFHNAGDSGAHPLLAGLAADPRLAEAVERMSHWNFTTPTGIAGGYDADPDEDDAEASVATTIYSVWRSRAIANTIDNTLDFLAAQAQLDPAALPRPAQREESVTALKHLLERNGIGESGLNFFFFKTGIADPATSRDVVVLLSLAEALDLLASDSFAPAFGNSTNQDDYRWGRLHRIVFKHQLGVVENNFNVPPGFGFFAPPLAGLAGIPVDGGFETVDEAPHNPRVSDSDSLMFDFGPTGRFVARTGPWGVKAETSLPGGESAVPGSPFYLNLLEPYLNNETFRMNTQRSAIEQDAVSIEEFVPAGP